MELNLKVHHLGIKVKGIEKSLEIYEGLGYVQSSDIVLDTIQNNRIVFLRDREGIQILELIEPMDIRSSVSGFEDGYHHICYEVEGAYFKDRFECMRIGKIFAGPVTVPAIQGRKAWFGCLNNGMFIEFLL